MSAAQAPAARGLFGNAYLLLALASLCWSGNHLMGRAIAGHVPPLTISTLRWLLAAAILYPFVRAQLRRDWPAIRQNLGVLAYLSLLGGGVFGALQFVGLQLTTALNVSVMNSLGPVFIAAASAAMFRDRLTGGQLAGIVISLLGVLAIISKLDPAVFSDFSFNIGDIIVFLNMVLWAVYSASLRWRPKIHPLSFMFMFALISGVVMFPTIGVGVFDRLRAAADAADILGDRLRDGLLDHRGVRVVGARRRADRAEPGRGVPAPDPDLQRAADRRAARRAAALLSRGRLRADPARRVVR